MSKRPQAALAAAQSSTFRAELLSDLVEDSVGDCIDRAIDKPKKKLKAKAEPMEVKPKSEKKAKTETASRVEKSKARPTATVDLTEDTDDNEVLLGHVISRCVGIQHYFGNGCRYNKEPLHLRREPNNRYDPNAIAVYTVPGGPGGGRKVGHVEAKTGDVAAITRVADGLHGVKIVGQVQSGAGQVYKFPLRVSFFGPASSRERIRQLLGYQLLLHEPKQRKTSGRAKSGHAQVPSKRSKSSGAGSSVEPHEEEGQDADDDVEVTGEVSWEQRDTELRKHAIELD